MRFDSRDQIQLSFSVTASDGRIYTPYTVVGDSSWAFSVHGLTGGHQVKVHGNLSAANLPFYGPNNVFWTGMQSVSNGSNSAYNANPDFQNNWVIVKDTSSFSVSGTSAWVTGQNEICRYLRVGVAASLSGNNPKVYFFDKSNIGG